MKQSRITYYYRPIKSWDLGDIVANKPADGFEVHASIGREWGGREHFLCGCPVWKDDTKKPKKEYKVCPKCKALKDANLSFVCLRAGQDRRYGDTHYEFEIFYEGEDDNYPSDDEVYKIAQTIIHEAADGDKKHHFRDSVLNFQQVAPGKWNYLTGHMYTD